MNGLKTLHDTVIQCRLCPRLVAFRESVPARASFAKEEYWRRPVPGFGDPHARLLITGLAPSMHGANRTGRIFTGDPSADFLFKGLYQAGFASQPTSETRDDGLKLKDCYITAAVKCCPPIHKPTSLEIKTCSRYYHEEIQLLKGLTDILVLGKTALDAFLSYAKTKGYDTKGSVFKFGACYTVGPFRLWTCYHPSPQNTYTGKFTDKMFLELLGKIKIQLKI